MSVKEWIHKWQPTQLYIILTLTIILFIVELIISHTTHALTMLMDSYHMLCNIIALTGCIITVKHDGNNENPTDLQSAESVSSDIGDEVISGNKSGACKDKKSYKVSKAGANKAQKLKNTFGWARVDVIFMLVCFVFLASLSFSLVVEAIQTLVHIDHQDEMHNPLIVMSIGAAGLILNGICYLLIGGYTFHQGSFLYVTASGDVVLDRVVTGDSVQAGGRRLSRTRHMISTPPQQRQRQGFREMARDVLGCVIVIITSLLVYFTEADVAKFIDPLMAVLSAALLLFLSYPYMKESCLILLQTIPGTINIDSLKTQLVEHFPDIVNVHDLHIWQLTASKIISTVHIIFDNPKVYGKLIDDLKEFFLDNGITQVTIQPEFFSKSISLESLVSEKKSPLCLMSCQTKVCETSHCCQDEEIISNSVWQSREMIPTESTLDLKSINTDEDKVRSDSDNDKTEEDNHQAESEDIKTNETNEIKEINKAVQKLNTANEINTAKSENYQQ